MRLEPEQLARLLDGMRRYRFAESDRLEEHDNSVKKRNVVDAEKMASIEHKNIFEFTEGCYRGGYGMIDEKTLNKLYEAGIRHIFPLAPNDEASDCAKRLGINVHEGAQKIPYDMWQIMLEAKTRATKKIGDKIHGDHGLAGQLVELREAIGEGGVFIGCSAGIHKTSDILAMYDDLNRLLIGKKQKPRRWNSYCDSATVRTIFNELTDDEKAKLTGESGEREGARAMTLASRMAKILRKLGIRRKIKDDDSPGFSEPEFPCEDWY
jgi:hypothetical protein